MSRAMEFQHLSDIFAAALARVDPYRMILNRVRLNGSLLTIDIEDDFFEVDLNDYQQLYVMGTGKATAKMALAFEEILGARIDRGLIAVKYGHTETLNHIETLEAGHPVPDDASVLAGQRMLEMATAADEKTLVIHLISGGGSALLACPFQGDNRMEGLSLADKQQVTRALLACGATINEINAIRKHLSDIKGGRLARAIAPARCLSFILSDVVGDRLDAIASGLTSPDHTTFADCLEILNKYDIAGEISARALAVLQRGADGELKETPKPGDAIFDRVANILIGSNYVSLLAARDAASQWGYHTTILTSQVSGEAREWAKVLVGIGKDIRKASVLGPKPACIIAGGETTVTLRGKGKGGRNQEIALAALAEMQQDPENCGGLYLLSASTDGNDGPTDAAGAFAAVELLADADQKGLSVGAFLRDNDAYTFFDQIDGLLKTGPTNTNVCDLQILIVTE
ncbi:MAG: glycerate kinase [Desulfuromonadales bacterium]|nr:glycerate kinase [Desulfuromonadales bacterium]MDW7756667.1 glycerate kinase [Desulfuromonadales bacterium]